MTRRAEALGYHDEAHLRGLEEATEVDFVVVARPFISWASVREAPTA